MNLRFDITGVPALDLKLQRMPRRVQKKIVTAALRPLAEEIKAEAIATVGVDTGALRSKQKKRAFAKRGRMGYRIGSQLGSKAGPRGYANLAELGSRRAKGSAYLRGPLYGRRLELARRGRQALIAALQAGG